MGLFKEIFAEAFFALMKSRTRSALTMLGVIWGITSVTLLIAYGTGFRTVLSSAFEAFGSSAVICWPQQTSDASGGQRGGKVVKFEQADVDYIKATSTAIKSVSMETVKYLPAQYGDRLVNPAVRGVYPEYGEVRTLPFTAGDDYESVVSRIGYPESSRSGPSSDGRVFFLLRYPDRAFTLVLLGPDRVHAAYIGAFGRGGRVIHSVALPDGHDSTALLTHMR